jgi:hypothetical protein
MWVPVQRPVLIRHDGSCPLLTGAVGGSWQLLRIPHLKPKPLAALSFQTQARYPILPAQELCFDLVSLPGCSWVCGQPQLTVDRTTWTSVQEAPARAPPQDPKDEDEQDVEKTKGWRGPACAGWLDAKSHLQDQTPYVTSGFFNVGVQTHFLNKMQLIKNVSEHPIWLYQAKRWFSGVYTPGAGWVQDVEYSWASRCPHTLLRGHHQSLKVTRHKPPTQPSFLCSWGFYTAITSLEQDHTCTGTSGKFGFEWHWLPCVSQLCQRT